MGPSLSPLRAERGKLAPLLILVLALAACAPVSDYLRRASVDVEPEERFAEIASAYESRLDARVYSQVAEAALQGLAAANGGSSADGSRAGSSGGSASERAPGVRRAGGRGGEELGRPRAGLRRR